MRIIASRDMGFLQKPGTKTRAASDVEAYVAQPPRGTGATRPANAGATNRPAPAGNPWALVGVFPRERNDRSEVI
jgi:hypothetical protein